MRKATPTVLCGVIVGAIVPAPAQAAAPGSPGALAAARGRYADLRADMRNQNFVRKPAYAAVRAALAGNLSLPNGSTNIGFNGTFTGSNPAPVTLTLNGNTCSVT